MAGGCGGGDEGSTASNPANRYARGGSAESQAPKGASRVLREIYRQFPAPKPDSGVKGSAAAIKAGERACADKTPLEVKEAFYPVAIEAGGLEAGSDKAKMIDDIETYAKQTSHDGSFVAGQLAAGAYEATLPEATARYGYQGCVYVLARRLKRELVPKAAR